MYAPFSLLQCWFVNISWASLTPNSQLHWYLIKTFCFPLPADLYKFYELTLAKSCHVPCEQLGNAVVIPDTYFLWSLWAIASMVIRVTANICVVLYIVSFPWRPFLKSPRRTFRAQKACCQTLICLVWKADLLAWC